MGLQPRNSWLQTQYFELLWTILRPKDSKTGTKIKTNSKLFYVRWHHKQNSLFKIDWLILERARERES